MGPSIPDNVAWAYYVEESNKSKKDENAIDDDDDDDVPWSEESEDSDQEIKVHRTAR